VFLENSWKKKKYFPLWVIFLGASPTHTRIQPASASLSPAAAMWGLGARVANPSATSPSKRPCLSWDSSPKFPPLRTPPAFVTENPAVALTGRRHYCARDSVAYTHHHGRLIPSRAKPSPRLGYALLRRRTRYRCHIAASP
jgi:hypothetical protein